MSGQGNDRDDDDLFAAWVEARATEEAPPAGARARLLDAVAGIGRFAPHLDAIARLAYLAGEALFALLRRIDEPDGWIDGPPGIRYFHFSPGPAGATPEAGIVRLRPGAVFPRHRHLGDEVSLVLEGSLVDDDGQRHGPGAVLPSAAGSEHAYTAGPGRDLVLLSLHTGIAFTDPDSFQLKR
jgi:quercetin dioxygenase-like cupin family protein